MNVVDCILENVMLLIDGRAESFVQIRGQLAFSTRISIMKEWMDRLRDSSCLV